MISFGFKSCAKCSASKMCISARGSSYLYDFRSFLALTAALAAFFDNFPAFASGEVRNRFYRDG